MVRLAGPTGGEVGVDGPCDSGSLPDAVGSCPSTVCNRADRTGDPEVFGMTVPPIRYTGRLMEVVSPMFGVDGDVSCELRRDLDRLPMKLLTLTPRLKGGVGSSELTSEARPRESVRGR